MTHDEFLAVALEQTAALAAAARAAGPDATVPATPEWTMAKLVKHTGTTLRWAAANVRTGEFTNPGSLDLGLPADAADYPDWIEAGARELVEVVGAADPAAPTWSWGVEQTAGFWSRRMAHETSIHRWDAESATDTQRPVDAALAVDGIDERLENLVPSMNYNDAGKAAMTGAGETIHLHATDVEGEWLLRFGPDGFSFGREHAKGDLAIRGPASDLLLVLVGRRGLDGLEVFGDAGVLDAHVAITRF
ncbi:MAG: maleylpyruvate isomerase family mycothiol-dependent enzyme [Acidimicrobiia bacterium]